MNPEAELFKLKREKDHLSSSLSTYLKELKIIEKKIKECDYENPEEVTKKIHLIEQMVKKEVQITMRILEDVID